MNKSVLFCCAVATLVLSGCAQQRLAPQSPCNHGVCKVLVTVTDCAAPGGIWVNVNPIPVDGPNRIEWTIDDEGFRFPDNGIVIDKDRNGDFVDYRPSPNGKKFTVRDQYKTRGGEFKYTINVARPGGGGCLPYDPYIYH